MTTRMMINLEFFLLALSLFFTSLVNAGHPVWEAGAATSSSKWIHIDPSDWTPTWPFQTIRYCYKNEHSKEKLAQFVRAGMQLWYAAGVPEVFRFVEHSKQRCDQEPQNYLHISGDSENEVLATTVGKTPSEAEPRPVMELNFRANEDFNWKTETVAHEIGHAWGLFHEHQDPSLWHFAPRGQPDRSLVLFYCENVIGYEKLLKLVPIATQLYRSNGPCRNRERAYDVDFMGAQMLPLQEPYQSPLTAWPQDEDINWNSIMIYGSRSFGQRDERGLPKVTLLRKQGHQLIPEPTVPNLGDVEGLLHLYHVKFGTFQVTLHNSRESVWYSLFVHKIRSCPIKE
ncbi:hypothetical protein BDV28DRAFT_134417 [Aspergillus coremiiformis]|uniref:Peptidase metallopeptidase domain-containing protein n=1 Tax=Aspergillus coremiiformis TaxID=138285 RepID=A0A5N6Z7G6_9EURO|nr:hypothetical protein BDV28DRAFT_134417 [Aspergillus coremiiformis]